MNLFRLLTGCVALAALISCTSSSSSPDNNGGNPGGGDNNGNGTPNPDDQYPPGLSDHALKVVIPTHTVQPGDSFECFYTDITPDRDIFVNGTTGKQGVGGHHITIYYATQAMPIGHHPCDDQEMMNWRQIGAAGQEAGNGIVDMPPGVATRVPSGHQIVVQTHYINTSAGPRDVQDEITVKLLAKEDVKAYSSAYAVVDLGFKVPAQGIITRGSACTLAKDYDFLLMLGHMHEWGAHYKLESLDATGKVLDTIFDEDWEVSYVAHPPTKRWPLEAPYHLAKGTKLRQTCTWKNTTTDQIAFPREMCVMFSSFLADVEMENCTDVEVTGG
jgi:hypothetical protein